MGSIRTDRFLLGIGIITLLLLLVFMQQMLGGRETLTAKQGILTLPSIEWLDKRVVSLDGEWAFYPNQLLSPEEIKQAKDRPVIMHVPGNWNDEEHNDGEIMSGKGYGTYRLLVRNVPESMPLAIAKRYIRFSDALYVNGQLLGQSGQPGISTETYQPRNVPYTVYFQSEGTEVEIVLQVANFDFHSGGINDSIDLGLSQRIEARAILQSGLELLTIGIVLILALLFFYLYFRLHRDVLQLLYTFFFIGFALIVFTNGERLLLQFFPEMPFEAAFKLKYMAVYSVPAIVFVIVSRIAARRMIKRWLQVSSALLALYVILVAVLPFRMYSYAQDSIYIMLLFTYAAASIMLLRQYARGEYGSIGKAQFQLLMICVWMMLINSVLAVVVIGNPLSQILLNGTTLLLLGTFALMIVYQYVGAYDSMRQLTHQLQLADKAKDDFLLLTSHELNSPLHSILHLSKALLSMPLRHTDEMDRREKLQLIRNTAHRMSNLVNDLIDMSRFKDGSMKVVLGTVDLATSISVVMEVLGFLANGKGIVLLRKIEPEARYIMADESRLLQVLYSIVYHMIGQQSHRELVFECVKHVDNVRITLRYKPRAAEPIGSKLEETIPSKEPSSAAAGLFIAPELVRLMGGELLASDAEEFIQIELKAATIADKEADAEVAASLEKAEQHAEGRPGATSGSAVILLATADLVDMEHLSTLLSTEGFSLMFASSGTEAQWLLDRQRQPDLVIVDALLPPTTGYELCRRIRNDFTQAELPVLFINMRSTPADIEACMSAGGNDFITRPLDAGEIFVRVHTLLGMKRLVKEAANNEMAFLRSQIKPHFLYNALGTIMSLCFTDGPRAGELLGSFSRYLRILFHLDNSEETIPLSKEMELVRAYVDIERERFGSRLEVEFDVDEALQTCKVMPLLIEPLVENAIRHGVSKRISGGSVRLSIRRLGDMVQVIVEDDGVGMPQQQVQSLLNKSAGGQGIGLQNVQRRLKHLNGQEPSISSEPGAGTKVTILFPFQ
ncbi:histidine kinase [Paenibacillus sp. KS-LC4]|uniref:histidine kinase n=1 Tax=Paenibacillus sp. KS-LC4 TaxID=2979727 RepID=UPI0030D17D37